MKITRTLPLLALLALVAVPLAGARAAAPSHASLAIRHQLRGCHSWSLNGGAYRARQSVVLHRGGTVTVVNRDVMPHKLVLTSGPQVVYARVSPGGMVGLKGTFGPAMLARIGAATKITFAQPGIYRFTTQVGEDYMAGVKTIGEDNVLRLTVRVV